MFEEPKKRVIKFNEQDVANKLNTIQVYRNHIIMRVEGHIKDIEY